MKDCLMQEGRVYIDLEANASFSLCLRIPAWSNTYKVFIGGEKLDVQAQDGYVIMEREWSKETICLELDVAVKKQCLNGKIAFMKGPFVLSKDNRLGKKIKPFVNSNIIQSETVLNQAFRNNVTVQMNVDGESIVLCDYAQAGKNFDEGNCDISVWFDMQSELS